MKIRELWREADYIWQRYQDRRAFRSFVSADYHEVYQALAQLRGRVTRILEWGSGLGVVTIMAGVLGFEAYGIESEPSLVECSRQLAKKYGVEAEIVLGTFIPSEYEWNPELGEDSLRSDVNAEPGYDELDMELRDFDLVYAYPWPEEHLVFVDILRQLGGEHSLFMSYDSRDGVALVRPRS